MSEQPIKLPEWRSCLEVMLADGVDYNKTYPVEFFERELRIPATAKMRFSLSISQIRRELQKQGFHLSGKGGNGKIWTILPAANNAGVMHSYNREAANALKRGVILGTNTPLELLTEQERRLHEKILEKMATRQVLLNRSEQIRKVIEKEKPRLLLQSSE